MQLDERLQTVADCIGASPVHVDVGSDHGYLLHHLLSSGQVELGIAIENKQQPFVNSQATLAGLNAEVRLADGLTLLESGEANSLSICGMGTPTIVGILQQHPQRVPHRVVLQPNKHPAPLRAWALEHDYHLVDEQIAIGFWSYVVLSFQKGDGRPDAAYHDVDREMALAFGPLLLQRRDKKLLDTLQREATYLAKFTKLEVRRAQRLESIRQVLRDVFI